MNRYTLLLSLVLCSTSQAATLTSVVYSTDPQHEKLGTIEFRDSDKGLLITPSLTGLPAGVHGFHLHQVGNCGNAGMDAGSHFDPASTNTHKGPQGHGHLGDLPTLTVNASGAAASTPLLAPHLKTSEIKGLSVMIHAGGDNYSDQPPLGGGGARIACGVIQ